MMTLQSTAYGIFFLQFGISQTMKMLTLSMNLNSSAVIVFLMLVYNSFPFSSFIRGSMGVTVVSVVVSRCVFPLKFLTLRFFIL